MTAQGVSLAPQPPSVRWALGTPARRDHNLSVPELYEHAIRGDEGVIAHGGPLLVRTGKHTGRSPRTSISWTPGMPRRRLVGSGFNTPISEAHYDALRQRMIDHLANRDMFVHDSTWAPIPAVAGPCAIHRVRLGEHLLRQPVLRPPPAELAAFTPDFTI